MGATKEALNVVVPEMNNTSRVGFSADSSYQGLCQAQCVRGDRLKSPLRLAAFLINALGGTRDLLGIRLDLHP